MLWLELDTSYVWKHVDKDQILWLKLDLYSSM